METEVYRYVGNKSPVDYTERIVLEGGADEPPRRFVDMGGEVELTEAEHDHLKVTFDLRKVTTASKLPRGYDNHNADKAIEEIQKVDDVDLLDTIRTHETENKNRTSVIDAIGTRVAELGGGEERVGVGSNV